MHTEITVAAGDDAATADRERFGHELEPECAFEGPKERRGTWWQCRRVGLQNR
jgi:hypothetical protein